MPPKLEQIAKDSKASQGQKELLWLLQKLEPIRPKVILEIGVHLGHSLKVWQDAFSPAFLVGIDNETNETLENYLKDDSFKAKFLLLDSHNNLTAPQVIEALEGNFVDFLFIDGDHMYDGVKRDFEMYAPLVKSGGIIAFDDMDLFDNESVEVYRFWNELVESGKYKHNSYHEDSNGIGVIYV